MRLDIDSRCIGRSWNEGARKLKKETGENSLSIIPLCLLCVRAACGVWRAAVYLLPTTYYQLPSTLSAYTYTANKESESACAPCRGERLDVCYVCMYIGFRSRLAIRSELGIDRWIPYPSFRTDRPDEHQNSLLHSLNRPDLATSPKNSTFRTHARTESPTFTQAAPFSPRLTPADAV